MESKRCVQCSHRVEKLYVQYSPGNIRLVKCENCKSIADDYIECELMIIIIDLILHKPKAYRHLLFNRLNWESMNLNSLSLKASLLFFLLDAYKVLILTNNSREWSFNSMLLKVMASAFFGNIIFFSLFVGLSIKLLDFVDEFSSYKDILLAVIVSSYFKVFMVAMAVWKFPSLVVYFVDLFVMSSNIVVLRVITQSPSLMSIGVCFGAHAAKLLSTWMINFY